MRRKVAVVGGGSWGSALTGILGENVARYSDEFEPVIKVWVLDEQVNGGSLVDVINQKHENIKYLPGIQLPNNVVATKDLKECVSNADILVLAIPQQFLANMCKNMVGLVKTDAVAVSTVKGLEMVLDCEIHTLTSMVKSILKMRMAALMGANVALEVAKKQFCEATIGVESAQDGSVLKKLFQTTNFLVTIASDLPTVELCGALKNVIACAAGIVDGLDYGSNTKAAVIRIGFAEMTKFIQRLQPGSQLATFFESCGLGDVITSCFGGRNRKVMEAFTRHGGKIADLEKQLLNGQKLQGPMTAEMMYKLIEARGWSDQYPLMVAVHKICAGEWKAQCLVDYLREHPCQ